MKNTIALALAFALATAAFGQSVDLGEIEISDLDLTKADLSDAEFYFAGPVDLLVLGVEYMGSEYAALLKYDGRGRVEIAAPAQTTPQGLPYALDLSEVRATLVSDGIRLSNVIADGYYFAGKLVPTSQLDLAVASPIEMGGEAGVSGLAEDANELREQVADLRSRVAEVESERDEAQEQLGDARSQVASLEERLQSDRGPEDALAPAANVRRTITRGFGGGSAASGEWSTSGSRLRQTSASDLYAKHVVPVRQNANELVYTFEGSGASRGWSGYGLHVLASDAEAGDLYGYGSSYLVWITRDPSNTQSDRTFVQLYRSFDDVHMVQLASRAIPRSIDSPFGVIVYVNRSEATIVVGVDDEPVLTFEDADLIRSGSEVAARALGPATITDLEVRSR
ncbi:MAG: hypothetical protein ACOC7V_13365 [Spirochaetota bacterium]